MFWNRPQLRVMVVLATSQVLPVRQALTNIAAVTVTTGRQESVLIHEARSTDGIYLLTANTANTRAHLVVLDPADVVEGDLSYAALAEILRSAQTPTATSAEFLADPATWWSRAREATGNVQHLPPRRVAITTYSGGVGKTTLALDTAVCFAKSTSLPVLVLEFTRGVSALRELTRRDLIDLYDCLNERQPPDRWRHVSVLPMVANVAQHLDRDTLAAYFADLVRQYVLVIADVIYPHWLFDAFANLVDLYLLPAVPRRPDTIFNAALLTQELADRAAKKVVVWNMVTHGDRLIARLAREQRELDLPIVAQPEFDGRLGRRVLPLIYPHGNW